MICQFTVKNYKSIKEELTLDLQAMTLSEHTESVIKDRDGETFLPLAAIYGPNGGGKSTVLEALNSLLLRVMSPVCAACANERCEDGGKKANIVPFKFAKETLNMPTQFILFFRTKEAEYQYCLDVKGGEIVFENLKKKNIEGVKYTELFVRNKEKSHNIQLKAGIKKIKVGSISNNLPLLSYLFITNDQNAIIGDIRSWFEDGINYKDYGDPFVERGIAVINKDEVKKLIIEMMQEMDLNISEYRIKKVGEDETDRRVEIFTTHLTNGGDVELRLEEESSGTQKLFGLIPYIAMSIICGTTLIIDELDAKIHPQLLEYIIKLYGEPKINKKGAQLIFTSHDLLTMSGELFRRDEIWFVAKGTEQDSQMYSLAEIKTEDGKSIRKDARFDKQYIEGKYGADPYLKKIIDWEVVNDRF